ncbi:MAG: hypothetical protein WD709_04745 [Gammaproteobacteria bacterium]
MSLSIIELNDSEIRVASGNDIILRHPGYAVLKGDTIETGPEAVKSARSNPRSTYNRYWSQLSQDSLIVPSHIARHHADLAYAQLLALHEQAGQPDEILFAVPGSYSKEQLSLLLGIVESCPFTAVGLVDAATACTAAIADTGNYSHLDLHLHYAVITTLEVTDQVSRKSVRIIDNNGLVDIYDTCAGYLSDLFIDQSRFDPLHHAETEQSLYDQLPHCLNTMNSANEVTLEIQYRDKRYQARIFREPLLEKLKQHYEKIYREIAGTTTSLVSDRLNALPGFTQQIGNVVNVAETDVFQGCNINLANIRSAGPSLSFITSLPATKPSGAVGAKNAKTPVAGKDSPESSQHGRITHALVNHRAYALGSEPLYLSASGEVTDTGNDNAHCTASLDRHNGARLKPISDLTVFVNGVRVNAATEVAPGDTVSFAGSDTVIRFIEVTGN